MKKFITRSFFNGSSFLNILAALQAAILQVLPSLHLQTAKANNGFAKNKTDVMKTFFTKYRVIAVAMLMANLFFVGDIHGQAIGDYRTRQTGNWSDGNTWERWNGATWITAVSAFPLVASTNTSAQGTAATAHNAALPSGIVTGDLLIVFYADEDNNSTITTPAGWTAMYNNAGTGNRRNAAFYRIADGSEGASVNIVTSANETAAQTSYRISVGSFTGVPVWGTAATGTSTTPDPPSLTSGFGAVNALWIAASHSAGDDNAPTPTHGTYTNLITGYSGNATNNHARVATAQLESATATQDPGTFTLGSSVVWAANTVAIRGATVTAAIPTSADGVITIRNGHTVTITAAASADECTIETTGQVTVNAGQVWTIANGTGTDLSVNGIVLNSGTITMTGTATYNAGSTYQHAQNGGIIPTATWNATSTCNITGAAGATMPAGIGQSFGNLTWNWPTQSADTYFNTAMSIQGNFTVSETGGNQLGLTNTTTNRAFSIGGDCIIQGANTDFRATDGSSGNATMTISGNYSQTGGNFRTTDNTGAGTVNITGNFTITDGEYRGNNNTGPSTTTVGGNLIVSTNNTALVNIESGLGNSSFSVTGNATLSIGEIRIKEDPGTGTSTFSVGGNFSQSSGTFTFRNTGGGAATMNVTGDFSLSGTAAYNMTSSGVATLDVNGNYSLTAGTHNMSSGTVGNSAFGTMNLAGNFSHTGGTITETSTGNGNIVFDNAGIQTYTSGGTVSNTINFTVNSGSTLQMAATGTTVNGGGLFTLSSGATLGITSTEGITTAACGTGATCGNIRTTTRTFDAAANYIYNGTGGAQASGNGLPATVSNLTVNNTAGVTLAQAETVTNNFSIGLLAFANLGTFTHTAGTLTLGGSGTNSGSWGSTSSAATYKTDVYFALTTGTVGATSGSCTSGIWLGVASDDWSGTSNWCGAVPISTSDVTIPTGAPIMPKLPSNITINNIVLQPGTTLDINGNTFTIDGTVSGTGTLTGSATSNLVIGGSAGTLNFTQTNAATRSLSNLTLNSGASATLGNNLDVYGTVTLTSASTLDLNAQNLTLKSNIAGTARIADLTGSTLNGATNVTMERYIKLRAGGTGRAYRLLAPTVNTSGSINFNWQENQNNTATGYTNNINTNPGFGTHITGAGGATNSFDQTQNNQASLYTVTNALVPTYTAVGATTGTLDAKTGYFLFVRGDRSSDINLFAAPGMPTTSTTLRTTGTLLTSDQSFTSTLSTGDGIMNLVTNPYASPISWSTVYSDAANTNLKDYYTYWDANVGTRGGFVTVTNGGVVTPTPSGGVPAATVNIQPGQAFFVTSNGASAPSLILKESHKVIGNNTNVFLVPPESFSVNVFFTEPNNYRRLADGVTALYDDTYTPGIDGNDALEINNWDENIALVQADKHLAIESRPVILTSDTLHLFMNNMKQRAYEFEFTPASFTNIGLKAELIDNFLNTRSLLSVVSPTVVAFSVTADAASSASNRFMVVFGPQSPLAIDVLTISAKATYQPAAQGGNGVQVNWSARTEKDMDRYELERSFNGTSFTAIYTKAAVGNSPVLVNYSWLDVNAKMGNNFYRIKAIDKNGLVKYTDIVKVNFGKSQPGITIAPNPVIGNSFELQLYEMSKGTYSLTMVNYLGQTLYSTQVQHTGGSATIQVTPGAGLVKGMYIVVLSGDDTRITQRIFKN